MKFLNLKIKISLKPSTFFKLIMGVFLVIFSFECLILNYTYFREIAIALMVSGLILIIEALANKIDEERSFINRLRNILHF